MPTSDLHLPAADRHSIAIITLVEEMFHSMRRELSRTFRVRLASNEGQIKNLVDDPDVHGIVLDLESIGEGPADAIEVLQEIRRLREDLILLAITESTSNELPLQFNAGRGRPLFPEAGGRRTVAGAPAADDRKTRVA